MTKLVAEKIIELAQRGLKNPTALHLATLQEFRSNPKERGVRWLSISQLGQSRPKSDVRVTSALLLIVLQKSLNAER
jgi:hypothetical protein